ncbi:MAG: 2,3-bisphosphoglycerate-independent phosphoglycerate mutase [Patescibacteria group bacterium]
MKRTYTLVILDGWGFGKVDDSNPIHQAQLKTFKFIEDNFPYGALQASGISIGMPWDEEGNSEIGHLTIGAGRVFYQHYPKITLAIENGSFFENKTLKNSFAHTKKNNSALHLIGLVGEGVVHSAFTHLVALLDMAKREGCAQVYIHVMSDGRDGAPQLIVSYIEKLREEIKKYGVGTIATLIGRYYGMDRDRHWDRTKKAYDMLVYPEHTRITDIKTATEEIYAKKLNDEYIEPTIINEIHPIEDGDSVLFFNFREDRMRQIVEPFVNPEFSTFQTKKFQNLLLTTMTEYRNDFSIPVVFEREEIIDPLGKVISDSERVQLRIAETEKYAHITYFFNGLQEKPYSNEYRVLIPSKNVAHHEEHPEMMASAITDRVIIALNEGGFDFILVNYANPDIIAHTGDFEATVKAVRVIDAEIERLMNATLAQNHVLIITSDHGNAETLISTQTGQPETKHDANPVPFYLIGREFQKQNTSPKPSRPPVIGLLSDVAPTILALMGIKKPKEMTGQSLLEQLI